MKITTTLTLLCACLLTVAAWAHELPANRATLVLRDDTHVSLTAFIDYAEALHQTLAPQQTPQEFLLLYASMKPADFRAAAAQAQALWRSGTRLALSTGEPLAAQQWQWPDPEHIQSNLKARAMYLLTGGDGHDQVSVDEIHAEATVAKKIGSLSVELPQQWGRVLVVSYRPRQAWKEPGSAPLVVGF
jgi:hypothetical protein